jgi:hypothetical protein
MLSFAYRFLNIACFKKRAAIIGKPALLRNLGLIPPSKLQVSLLTKGVCHPGPRSGFQYYFSVLRPGCRIESGMTIANIQIFSNYDTVYKPGMT